MCTKMGTPWELLWCEESAFKKQERGNYSFLRSEVQVAGGTVMRMRKCRQCLEWLPSRDSVPWLAILGWREAKPCMDSIMDLPLQERPTAVAVVLASPSQQWRADTWLRTLQQQDAGCPAVRIFRAVREVGPLIHGMMSAPRSSSREPRFVAPTSCLARSSSPPGSGPPTAKEPHVASPSAKVRDDASNQAVGPLRSLRTRGRRRGGGRCGGGGGGGARQPLFNTLGDALVRAVLPPEVVQEVRKAHPWLNIMEIHHALIQAAPTSYED